LEVSIVLRYIAQSMAALTPFPPRTTAYAALLLTAAIWGSNGAIAKLLFDSFAPITLSWLRWLVVMLVAAPFAWRERVALRSVVRTHWKILLPFALLGGAPQSALVYAGLAQSSAIHLGLLNSVIPVLILVLGWLLFAQRILPSEAGGITISMAGVLVILFQGSLASLAHLAPSHGDLLILAGMLLWAVYTLKLNHRPPQISLTAFIFIIAGVSLPMILPLMVFELMTSGLPRPGIHAVAGMLYLGAIPALLGSVLFGYGVKHVGPTRAGVFIHVMPLFACLFAALIAGEALHPYHAAGFVLVASGAWISCHRAAPVLSSAPAACKY
jgi:drug/metabolite transporter (DMT)-like permease